MLGCSGVTKAGGCLDGSKPVKSISADGTYFVYNCGGSNTTTSSTSSQKVVKALAGIDIENDSNVDFFKPPMAPFPTDKEYWWGRKWKIADYNNDGFSDVFYVGTMRPSNVIQMNMFADNPGDGELDCGNGDKCEGRKPLPSLYFGDADGNLTYQTYLLVDNREIPGMALGGQPLIADYNNDGVLDFYVTDPGVQDFKGHRDSYFLSQPDGTWLESSNTHLSHPNFKASNTGATGDIDNDGDMDVVYTEMNRYERGTSLWCLMNDGTGFLKKRKCGGADAFNIELADLDGDGDLDVLLGGHEQEYGTGFANTFTGIIWNDGKGKFPKHKKTLLPMHKQKFSIIPEISASDLDNDGDLDIVYSRTNNDYEYPGIQIIENLGNKKFKGHGVISLDEKSGHVFDVKFRDFDGDGDNDIYLSSEGAGDMVNGTVLLNNDNFIFDLIRPDEALTLYTDGSDSKIKFNYKKHALTDEAQSVEDEIAAFEAELEAELDAMIVK
jgi:hypothetical protein